MAIDWDSVVNGPVMSVFAEAVRPVYTPVKSAPGAPAFAVDGIFDRAHEVVLEELANTELKGSGHSTSVPVLSVRRVQFAADPKQGDAVVINGESFFVWDAQPDGRGMVDLVLRKP